MLNYELDLLSGSFTKELRHLDAHIYYDQYTRSEAFILREKATLEFIGKTVYVGRMIDYPVGPHPVPMFELNYTKKMSEEISQWLAFYRGNLTVLIHEVTGNDERDHSVGAIWLGTPIILDISKFELAK